MGYQHHQSSPVPRGPAFAPSGIWRPISLHFVPQAALVGVTATASMSQVDRQETAALRGISDPARAAAGPASQYGAVVRVRPHASAWLRVRGRPEVVQRA